MKLMTVYLTSPEKYQATIHNLHELLLSLCLILQEKCVKLASFCSSGYHLVSAALDSMLTPRQFLWSYNSDKTSTDFDVFLAPIFKPRHIKAWDKTDVFFLFHDSHIDHWMGERTIFVSIYNIIYESIYGRGGTFWPDQSRGGGRRKLICAV